MQGGTWMRNYIQLFSTTCNTVGGIVTACARVKGVGGWGLGGQYSILIVSLGGWGGGGGRVRLAIKHLHVDLLPFVKKTCRTDQR